MSDVGFFLVALTAIFVVVDPLAIVPVFASLTGGRSGAQIAAIALRASIVGAALLSLFAVLGGPFLGALGIRLEAFRIAGGLLLLLAAVEMLRGKLADCRCTRAEIDAAGERDDIAVVPVATPLLAGTGAMATVMLLMSRADGLTQKAAILAAILMTFAASYWILRAAASVSRVVGASTMAALQRVLGLVLAAMAIQFMVDGGVAALSRL